MQLLGSKVVESTLMLWFKVSRLLMEEVMDVTKDEVLSGFSVAVWSSMLDSGSVSHLVQAGFI